MTDEHNNRHEMMPRILDIIREGKRFVVTGHEMVDGDSTGCEVALRQGLASLGKTVDIVNNETIMSRYEFLDEANDCRVFEADRFEQLLADADAAIVVDNNSWARLKNLEAPLRTFKKPVMCIDHHRVLEPFSAYHLVDTTAAATGELVYDLLCELEAEINPLCAQALFVSLTADTGWFRYSNTTPRSFEIARELVLLGADPDRVNRETNYQETLSLRRLMGEVWNRVELGPKKKTALAVLDQELMRRYGIKMKETDGFIDELRALKGVGIVALIKELANGEIKMSLRSVPPFSAHVIARQFEGGGHRHASGATLEGPLDAAVAAVTAALREVEDQLG